MQITPIKNTHAYILISLVNINPEDPITVSYTKDGYHDPSQDCLCKTCKPDNPPASPERHRQPTDIPEPKPGKKRRRGGKRARVRRENQGERINAQGEQEGLMIMDTSENDNSE